MTRILIVMMTVLGLAAPVLAQSTPQPAWCGGSYSVTGGLDLRAYEESVAKDVYPSGTNFAECVEGTYPETPATDVVFEGGKAYRVTRDANGQEQRVELTPPARREAAK